MVKGDIVVILKSPSMFHSHLGVVTEHFKDGGIVRAGRQATSDIMWLSHHEVEVIDTEDTKRVHLRGDKVEITKDPSVFTGRQGEIVSIHPPGYDIQLQGHSSIPTYFHKEDFRVLENWEVKPPVKKDEEPSLKPLTPPGCIPKEALEETTKDYIRMETDLLICAVKKLSPRELHHIRTLAENFKAPPPFIGVFPPYMVPNGFTPAQYIE